MYAVVATIEIDPARGGEAKQMLESMVVPQAKATPGGRPIGERGRWRAKPSTAIGGR